MPAAGAPRRSGAGTSRESRGPRPQGADEPHGSGEHGLAKRLPRCRDIDAEPDLGGRHADERGAGGGEPAAERKTEDDPGSGEHERLDDADPSKHAPRETDGVGERELPLPLPHGHRDGVIDDEGAHDEPEEARGREHRAQREEHLLRLFASCLRRADHGTRAERRDERVAHGRPVCSRSEPDQDAVEPVAAELAHCRRQVHDRERAAEEPGGGDVVEEPADVEGPRALGTRHAQRVAEPKAAACGERAGHDDRARLGEEEELVGDLERPRRELRAPDRRAEEVDPEQIERLRRIVRERDERLEEPGGRVDARDGGGARDRRLCERACRRVDLQLGIARDRLERVGEGGDDGAVDARDRDERCHAECHANDRDERAGGVGTEVRKRQRAQQANRQHRLGATQSTLGCIRSIFPGVPRQGTPSRPRCR